jgi:hypothetical protein
MTSNPIGCLPQHLEMGDSESVGSLLPRFGVSHGMT